MADNCNFGALTATGFVEHSINRVRGYLETVALGPTINIAKRPAALDPTPEDGLAHAGWIYLDPISGDDLNDGTTLIRAVKTLNQAAALLTVTEINIHIWASTGGFQDLFLDMTATVYIDLANLEILQCQPATAANVEIRQHGTAVLGVNPQFQCQQMDNVNLTAPLVGPVGGEYDWTRAVLNVAPAAGDNYITYCKIESGAFCIIGAVNLTDVYIENTILESGIVSRVVQPTYPDIWGNGAGSVDVNTFDERYTGCIYFPANGINHFFTNVVCHGPGGTGAAITYGNIDNTIGVGTGNVRFNNSTAYGYGTLFRIGQSNATLGQVGFPGPMVVEESIVDNIGSLSAFDPSLSAVTGDGGPYNSIINASLNDPLLAIIADNISHGVAVRRWDSEDYRLQIAGVEYAPGLPFSVTSPAIDFQVFPTSIPVTIGAWVPEITEAPYSGTIARFVEGFSPNLKLSAIRTNYQSWNDIQGSFHAVWDSTVWLVEFTLDSRWFTGTDHSIEWTKLLRAAGTKRLWPDGLQGVLTAVPQDFTSDTVDVNLSRPLDTDLYSGWVLRLGTTADKWDEPAGLVLPAVAVWVGIWMSGDDFGLAMGGTESATWDGSAWVAQGPGPGAGFDPVGDSGIRVIHGTSASNVWAVNDGGFIFRWVNPSWEQIFSPTVEQLNSVWAFSDNLAYAVGENGTLVAWDGISWSIVVIPGVGIGDHIINVWGSHPGDLWITVTNHGILHWNGVGWTDVTPTGAGTTFRTIYGSSPADVYAGIGQDLWHFDGGDWAIVQTLGNIATWDQIWGDGKGLYWASAAGNDGVDATGALWHWDGISWTKEFPPTGTLDNRTKIYGTPSAVYALGGNIDLQVLKREIVDSGHYLIDSNTGSRLNVTHLYGPDPLADVATVLADLVGITILYLPVELNTGDMPLVSEFYVDGALTPWRKVSDVSTPQEFHARTLKLKQSAEVVYE